MARYISVDGRPCISNASFSPPSLSKATITTLIQLSPLQSNNPPIVPYHAAEQQAHPAQHPHLRPRGAHRPGTRAIPHPLGSGHQIAAINQLRSQGIRAEERLSPLPKSSPQTTQTRLRSKQLALTWNASSSSSTAYPTSASQ